MSFFVVFFVYSLPLFVFSSKWRICWMAPIKIHYYDGFYSVWWYHEWTVKTFISEQSRVNDAPWALSLNLFIFSLTYIKPELIYIQPSYLYSAALFVFSHILYVFNLILSLLSPLLYSVLNTMWNDIVLQMFSCLKFKKHQIELEIRKTYRKWKVIL